MAHRVIRLVDGQIGEVQVNDVRQTPAEIDW
jgi:putative ABC transport system ATP-binding protein